MVARPDLEALLPRDKCDMERAEAIVRLGYPEIEPVLRRLPFGVDLQEAFNRYAAETNASQAFHLDGRSG
jgi:hypothetical protein